MSVARGLMKRIRKVIKKKPKELNEAKVRGVIFEGVKVREIVKILQAHEGFTDGLGSVRRNERIVYSRNRETEGRPR
ncbi:MAG: hypothetical protein QXY87_09530 [Saccharolobus sp.]|uniref:hypothetical protein n=1 Tax=Saccharolobus TaxID=2100760 RepID=UPI001F0F72F8|nr:hypothetical protein [Saccharolobus shibatae]MCH4815803.1 hypothetical protein [Saccharolobus shibatae]